MLSSGPCDRGRDSSGSEAWVTTITCKPLFRHMDAAAVPAGPEPITMISYAFAFWLFTIFLKITPHSSQLTTHTEIFHFAFPDLTVAIASFGFPLALATTWHTYNAVQSTLLRPKPSQVTFLPLTSTMTYR